MKVGYQGDIFSNARKAAKHLICDVTAEYIPFATCIEMLQAMKEGLLDYGVITIQNTLGGMNKDTDIICNNSVEILDRVELEIEHCLFSLTGELRTGSTVYGDIEALLQCSNNLKEFGCLPVSTSLIAAKMMVSGETPITAGIVCNKENGTHYGLHLVKENIANDCNLKVKYVLFRSTDIN